LIKIVCATASKPPENSGSLPGGCWARIEASSLTYGIIGRGPQVLHKNPMFPAHESTVTEASSEEKQSEFVPGGIHCRLPSRLLSLGITPKISSDFLKKKPSPESSRHHAPVH
jgi:hypothetical protein